MLAAGLSCLALAGCLDVEQDIAFQGDGTATITARVAFDREAEEVYAAVEAAARLSGDPTLAAAASGGFCSPGMTQALPGGVPATLEVAKRIEGTRVICEVRKSGVQLTPEMVDPLGLGVVTYARRGPRQLDVALDLEKLPDLTPFLMTYLLDELQKRPEVRNATRAGVYDLTEKIKRAATAMTAMAMRDRYVQLTVSAPRIVASTGVSARDAHSARLRLTFAELVDLMTRPEARRGRRFAVTAEH